MSTKDSNNAKQTKEISLSIPKGVSVSEPEAKIHIAYDELIKSVTETEKEQASRIDETELKLLEKHMAALDDDNLTKEEKEAIFDKCCERLDKMRQNHKEIRAENTARLQVGFWKDTWSVIGHKILPIMWDVLSELARNKIRFGHWI